MSDGVRVSLDPTVNPPKEVASIKKSKMVTIDIALPGLKYDLRLCLSSETPATTTSEKVDFTRMKTRTTYEPIAVHDAGSGLEVLSPFKYEATVVMEGNNRKVHEFEVEADVAMVMQHGGPDAVLRSIQTLMATGIGLISGL